MHTAVPETSRVALQLPLSHWHLPRGTRAGLLSLSWVVSSATWSCWRQRRRQGSGLSNSPTCTTSFYLSEVGRDGGSALYWTPLMEGEVRSQSVAQACFRPPHSISMDDGSLAYCSTLPSSLGEKIRMSHPFIYLGRTYWTTLTLPDIAKVLNFSEESRQ